MRLTRRRRPDPHTMAGPYALDALSEPDRGLFEQHLSGCDTCAQELRGLLETTALLGAATAAQPPARLRERVLAEVSRTRQLPPAAVPQDPPWPARRAAAVEGRPRRPWLPRLALALAVSVTGSLVAAAAAFGVVALATQHRLDQVQAGTHAIAAVLNAPDARMMTARARTGGTATVVMSHAMHTLVLTTAGLPALPSARSYQLWLMGPGGARPAGMLPAPRQGVTAPVTASGLAAGDMVALTVEPADGSARPTSPPILMLALPT